MKTPTAIVIASFFIMIGMCNLIPEKKYKHWQPDPIEYAIGEWILNKIDEE